MAKNLTCIQSISLGDRIQIHFYSFVFGIWILTKNVCKWIWNPSKSSLKKIQRDTPPSFLVDSSFGQHKHVKLKGAKLHYIESGSKEQPLLLLLHGFPDFWLSWRYQIPILSVYFHVIALDLKGFGDSDKPTRRSCYKIEIILAELTQFIHSLLGIDEEEKSCTIIGHDLGALLGWYLVHQNPKLISKFIAVSCPHPNVYWKKVNSSSSSYYNNSNYQWLNYVQLPYLPEINALNEDVKIIEQYHKHLPIKDINLEAYKYTFSRKEDWTGAINYYRNLPLFKINEDEHYFNQIKVPVILITGSKDRFISLENIIKSTEYCDNFRLKVIEDSGHFPQQENPERFNNILLKYLISNNKKDDDIIVGESPSKRLINGLFGAVSNTVKYGNSVIDSVQKKTNGVVNSIPSFSLNLSGGNK